MPMADLYISWNGEAPKQMSQSIRKSLQCSGGAKLADFEIENGHWFFRVAEDDPVPVIGFKAWLTALRLSEKCTIHRELRDLELILAEEKNVAALGVSSRRVYLPL